MPLEKQSSRMLCSLPKSSPTWLRSGPEWSGNSWTMVGQSLPQERLSSAQLHLITQLYWPSSQTHTKEAKKTSNLVSSKPDPLYWTIRTAIPHLKFTLCHDLPQNIRYVSFLDPNGYYDKVYISEEFVAKSSVGAVAGYVVASILAKHPKLKSPELPTKPIVDQQMVKEITVPITVGPDFTKFNEGMMQVGKAMAEMAKVMAGEWDKALKELGPAMEAIAKAAAANKKPKVADYALAHKGMSQRVKCPKQGCGRQGSLESSIIHLNDVHKWKREKIADWLDTLDEQPVFYPAIEGA